MSARDSIEREVRVAFSRTAQPIWFRILKWIVVLGVSAILWRTPYFWVWLVAALGLGLTIHLIWRWKTKGWTQPWRGWDDVERANRG